MGKDLNVGVCEARVPSLRMTLGRAGYQRHSPFVGFGCGFHRHHRSRAALRAAVHQVRSSIMTLACLSRSARPLSTSPP